MSVIPLINIAALFAGPSAARDQADAALAHAAFEIGFMTVRGQPPELRANDADRRLSLRLFEIPPSGQRSLWKRNFAAENRHLYRGWFPLSSSIAGNREGFELGPDILRPLTTDGADDVLCEPTPLPSPQLVPDNWLATAKAYFAAMESIGFQILDSLSRSLGIDVRIFRDAFQDGISTLRLLHYPAPEQTHQSTENDPGRFIEIAGKAVEQTTRPHVDSGLLTVLAQCGVGGLQAADHQGNWLDVPVHDDGFVINFGGLMELWTGGRIKATRHRVLSRGQERFSVPFFFEPRPSTRIAPLPGSPPTAAAFAPFLYGDHLWALTTRFPENFGLEALRPPREPASLATVPKLSIG